MSVGPFIKADFFSKLQSNSAIRRFRFVVDVRSVFFKVDKGIPDLRETSAKVICRDIGPEVPFGGLCTRIGYVLHTMTTRRTLLGGIPASERHPIVVVSREVTYGYIPWKRLNAVPWVPSSRILLPDASMFDKISEVSQM